MQYIYSEYILSHSLLAMKYIFSLVILLDYNILVIYTSGQYILYMTLCCVCAMERIYRVMVIFFQEGVSFQGDVLTHAHVTLATSNCCGCRWSTLLRRAIIRLSVPWIIKSHKHTQKETHISAVCHCWHHRTYVSTILRPPIFFNLH